MSGEKNQFGLFCEATEDGINIYLSDIFGENPPGMGRYWQFEYNEETQVLRLWDGSLGFLQPLDDDEDEGDDE